jgi:hypothetical protein
MRWCAIDEEGGSEISLIPKFQWHTHMREEGKADFYYVLMFLIRISILLVHVGT